MPQKVKIKKSSIPAIFLCIGFFVFPITVRELILPEKFYFVNYIVYMACFFIYRRNKKQVKTKVVNQDKVAKTVFWSISIFMLAAYFIVMLQREDYLHCFTYVVAIFIPALFINFKFVNTDYFNLTLKIWVYGLQIISFFMVLCGVIDKFTQNAVTYFFTELFGTASLNSLANSGRMVSYMGHALMSSEILLIFYVMYHLYTVVYKLEKEKMRNFLLALMGIAFTGSKTGIVLILLYFIVTHANWKNRKILSIGLVLMLILYWLGVFDTVITRVIEGLQSGDLSTNRNSSLQELLNSGKLIFNWFNGKNIEYGSWKMVAALEYPIFRWAYQFGIIAAICLILILFVYPLIQLIRLKAEIAYMIGSLLIMLCVNSYNGLALATDHVLIFSVTMIFIINMAIHSNN